MKFSVFTLFPKLIETFLSEGLVSQAVEKKLFSCQTINPRSYTTDAHHTVDDRAFGGSDGMVMKYEPLSQGLLALRESSPAPSKVILLSPQGKLWSHGKAKAWSEKESHIVLICGRYAGVDQRFSLKHCDEEISIGDYVLNGGELAACVVMESVVRLLPGALGNKKSAENDSFADGLLEAPVFTRPREVDGMSVPAPLLSGHHKEIAQFERAVALVRTKKLRPDLWQDSWEREFKSAVELLQQISNEDLLMMGLSRGDLHV